MSRRKTPRPSAAFVVTVALGCRTGAGGAHASQGEARVTVSDDGLCRYVHPSRSCPKGYSCNPPRPERIECPPELQKQGGRPTIAARPPGKEGWYRIPAELQVSGHHGCFFQVEGYCAPVHLDACERGPTIAVACRAADATVPAKKRWIAIDGFTYRDSLGTCRRVAAMECALDACPTTPVSDVVPCP